MITINQPLTRRATPYRKQPALQTTQTAFVTSPSPSKQALPSLTANHISYFCPNFIGFTGIKEDILSPKLDMIKKELQQGQKPSKESGTFVLQTLLSAQLPEETPLVLQSLKLIPLLAKSDAIPPLEKDILHTMATLAKSPQYAIVMETAKAMDALEKAQLLAPESIQEISPAKNVDNKPFNWHEKTVLVTGGTGTIGKEFIKTMLEEYQPKKIIVFSRDESKHHQMKVDGFTDPSIEYCIGDVRDAKRLHRAFKDVDVVIHTAAMKHVPVCEENPEEAVSTNIDGARNIIEAALEEGVERVLVLSSDKATAPSNLYGATKFVAEKLFTHANTYSEDKSTRFSCVRLGNVLGSRGSVVPLFRQQAATGKLTVTDENMTRFMMTPKQVINFIVNSAETMEGGEIFLPKLKSTRIGDLAHVIAPSASVEVIGKRPGEKLAEEFLSEEEATHTYEMQDKYVILPAEKKLAERFTTISAKAVPENFLYSSDVKAFAMPEQELKAMVESV